MDIEEFSLELFECVFRTFKEKNGNFGQSSKFACGSFGSFRVGMRSYSYSHVRAYKGNELFWLLYLKVVESFGYV